MNDSDDADKLGDDDKQDIPGEYIDIRLGQITEANDEQYIPCHLVTVKM